MVEERSVSYMMLSLQRIVLCHLLLHSVQSAIVNVALNQPAWQSSTDYQWIASRANDGNRSNVKKMSDNSCSHTKGSGRFVAWWQVDLGQLYVISHILITTRNWTEGPQRLAGFSIYVSSVEKDTWSNSELCFHDSNPYSEAANERRINCTNSINGQYLVVYNERPPANRVQGVTYSSSAILELCEVNVPIELIHCANSVCSACYTGWYGKRCENSCENCVGECFKENGTCKQQSCIAGYYGSKCTDKCRSTKCYNNECDFSSGECQRCIDGYFGPLCNQACPNRCISCTSLQQCNICRSGWYGADCSSNCSNCGATGDCDKHDGTCLGQSCKKGFYGPNCNQACSTNCAVDRSCDFSTGKCNHCPNGKYGTSCEIDCPVHCSTCEDGTNCIICSTGFYGTICSRACPGCGGNGSCSKVNGVCTSLTCKPKYYGYTAMCDRNCPSNCGGDGSCVLDHQNQISCSQGCANGFMGENCNRSCPTNCGGDATCSRESGACSNGCNPGWKGAKCDSECPFPNFGLSCTKDCGHCKNKSCDHINGTCMQGCEAGWMSSQCDIQTSKIVDNGGGVSTGVVGGAVGAIVVLVIIVVIVVIVLKRRSRGISKERGPSNNNGYMYRSEQDQVSTQNAMYTNIMSVEEEKRTSKPKIVTPKPVLTQSEPPKNADESNRTYCNTAEIKKGVEVTEFRAYVTQKLSSNKYEEEFKGIPYGAIHPTTVAEMPSNMKKNRFKTTFPYDHSRVVLTGKTDYINANFIEDTNGIKRYIATQGPVPNTVEDFWQMVWEYNIDIIVMLTNLQEGKKKKCEQYWPNPNEKMTHGHFVLTLMDERQFSYYSLRELEVHDTKSKQRRKIQQYHFTTWPDHGTPDPLFLVLFHKRVTSTEPKYDGPILVHCSAGIGRTGTFIALDALENQGKSIGTVDIENYVRIMRKDRMNMIQTSEQYKVLHESLIEAFQWTDTSTSMSDFPSVWQAIKSDKGPLNQQRLKKEYDMLREMRSDQENPVSALREENKPKSRTDSVLPLDKHRPYLSSYLPGGNDFINSVMIPSHISKDAFLVTQVPLPGTVVDFWRMIVDHDSRSIVYFASPSDDGTNFYPSDEDTVETEMHIIRKESSCILQEGVEEIKIQVKNKKSGHTKDVVMLKIDIEDNNYPSGAQIFRAAEIVELQRKRNKNCPCTVVALDGCTPCEVFCAISNILEYMKVDNRIDVFQTARQLQIRRPEFFGTFETYRYCYQIINEYLMTQSVYFNM